MALHIHLLPPSLATIVPLGPHGALMSRVQPSEHRGCFAPHGLVTIHGHAAVVVIIALQRTLAILACMTIAS
jgi:hypothetical protein